MSFDSFPLHTPQSIERREEISQGEKQEQCLSLARDIDFHLNCSRLFRGDAQVTRQIKDITKDAIEQGDIQQLQHMTNILKQEKTFMLSHLRWLARSDDWELPAITIQFEMQKAFIEKTIHWPESKQTVSEDEELRNAHQKYNLI